MPPSKRGLIRSLLLALWALVVLVLYLVEHPTIFTFNPYSDLTPILSGFHAGAFLRVAWGLVAAFLIFCWAGLAGRSALRRWGAPSGSPSEGSRDGANVPAFFPTSRSLAIPIACSAGFTAMILIVFALGTVGLFGVPIVILLGASFLVLGYDNRDLMRRGERTPAARSPRSALLLVFACGSLLAGLVMALSPLVATDALVYHLEIPRRYIEAGRIVPLPFNVYANMPHAAELIFAAAMRVGGEAAASSIDFGFRILLLLALAGISTRWLGIRGAYLAPCLLLTNPLVLDNRTVANVDIAMALFLSISLIEILRWRETGLFRHLLVASAFAGVLASMKYTGVLFAGALFATLLVLRLADRTGRGSLAHDLAFPFPALTLFLPWLVKNVVMTGNPVYPLLVEKLGGVEWNADLGARLVEWQRGMGMGRDLWSTLFLPWNMTIRGNLGYPSFDGILSPLYLMWIPALIVARPLPRILWGLLALSILSLGMWAWGPQQLRFFIPALPPLALLTAWSIERLGARPGSAWLGRAALWISIGFFALFTARVLASTIPNQLPSVIGFERREDYLHRRLQPYDMMVRASRELPPTAKLLLVWENRAYYLDRPSIADSFYEASWIMQLLEKDQSGDLLAEKLKKEHVTHVMVNVLLGKPFGRSYNPRVREALDRFVRERGKLLFEVNGLLLAELSEKGAKEPAKPKKKGP